MCYRGVITKAYGYWGRGAHVVFHSAYLRGSVDDLRLVFSLGGTALQVKCSAHENPPTVTPPFCDTASVLSLMASIMGQRTALRLS